MKKNLFLFTILFISCVSEKKLNNQELCSVLTELHIQDQFYRGLPEMEDPFFSVLDSLISANNYTRKEYVKLPKETQLNFGKIARQISDKKERILKKEEDSLLRLQKEIDYQTTERLLKIVKNQGFPNMEELNCENYAAPFLIFGHAPEKYWDKISKVIEKEKQAGRIGEGDYKYIKWHISGRKDNQIDQIQIKVN